MLRTIIYARVSTEDQLEKYGLPAQLRACREYAAAHGLTVIEEIADEGITGVTLDRPGLERLRRLVREGSVDVVLMLDPDRLSRLLAHLVHVKPEIETRARIEFVTGSFDDSASGRLFFNLKGSIAEYEREVIRDRTMRGRRERAVEGRIPGGRICYGYRCEDGKLAPDPDRAAVVQSIFSWFDSGWTMRAIALQLRAADAPSWSGRPWGHSSIRALLRNETFAGMAHYLRSRSAGGWRRELRPAEERIEIPGAALVSRAMFDRVQARLAASREMWHRRGGRPSAAYLLSGLLYCSCGRRMTGHGDGRGRYAAYRCPGRDALRAGSEVVCGSAPLKVSRVDGAVWQDIVAQLSDADLLRSLIAEHEVRMRAIQPASIAELEDRARQLRRREERALSLMLDPDLAADRGAIKREYQQAQRERAAIDAKIAAARPAQPSGGSRWEWVDRVATELREDLELMDSPADRQVFTRAVVNRVDWDGGMNLKLNCFIGAKLGTLSSYSAQFPSKIEFLCYVRLAA